MRDEKVYNLVQGGEMFAGTDDKAEAIRLAKRSAKMNDVDVVIEERRVTMLVKPNGAVIGETE